MSSLDVCSIEDVRELPLNRPFQLTSIGLFCCLRRIDVYDHERSGLALTGNHIRALLRQAGPSLSAFGESQTTTLYKPRKVKVWKVIHSFQTTEEILFLINLRRSQGATTPSRGDPLV
jgi:hypothetical protein